MSFPVVVNRYIAAVRTSDGETVARYFPTFRDALPFAVGAVYWVADDGTVRECAEVPE